MNQKDVHRCISTRYDKKKGYSVDVIVNGFISNYEAGEEIEPGDFVYFGTDGKVYRHHRYAYRSSDEGKVCDCGGEKAKTTHADWCSLKIDASSHRKTR